MKKKMLLQLQRQLEILNRRKQNLETKLWQIDNLPNKDITKDTYRQWHEVYCKTNYLALRIETIKSKMEMLSDKDIIRAVISSSKGLFNHLRRAN
jgi:chaperonin cofactor prefoldin